LRFSIPEQSLDFLGEPPAYLSPNVSEPPKEEKPTKDLSVPLPDPGEQKTEVTPEVKPEHEKPTQESTLVDSPVQVQAQEKQPDEKQVEEELEVQQDRHGGQRPADIELEVVSRQPPTATANPRPQQSTPTLPMKSVNHSPTLQANPQENKPEHSTSPIFPVRNINRNPTLQASPQENKSEYSTSPTFPARNISRNPPSQASAQENKSGVTGWFKSLRDF